MNNKIKIISKKEFDAGYPFDDCAMISILDETPLTVYDRGNRDDLLQICFWDMDPVSQDPDELSRFYAMNGFSPKLADKICQFVKQNIDKSFVIHCTMGVSRSGAVGRFVFDAKRRAGIETNWNQFMRDNPQIVPNVWVSKLLNETFIN